MSSSSHIQLSRSNPEETGYAEYEIELAMLSDDGFGGASRSRNIVHAGYTEYQTEIATMADDGFGSAARN